MFRWQKEIRDQHTVHSNRWEMKFRETPTKKKDFTIVAIEKIWQCRFLPGSLWRRVKLVRMLLVDDKDGIAVAFLYPKLWPPNCPIAITIITLHFALVSHNFGGSFESFIFIGRFDVHLFPFSNLWTGLGNLSPLQLLYRKRGFAVRFIRYKFPSSFQSFFVIGCFQVFMCINFIFPLATDPNLKMLLRQSIRACYPTCCTALTLAREI